MVLGDILFYSLTKSANLSIDTFFDNEFTYL